MSNERVFAADTIEAAVMPQGAGTTTRQLLLSPDDMPNFQMRRFVMQPGATMPNHTNSVEHEQYVLGGAAKVGIGDKVYNVKAGDVLYIPAGSPHWYETVGDEPYRFLCLGPNDPDIVEMVDKA